MDEKDGAKRDGMSCLGLEPMSESLRSNTSLPVSADMTAKIDSLETLDRSIMRWD
jgi:hypothetical protein